MIRCKCKVCVVINECLLNNRLIFVYVYVILFNDENYNIYYFYFVFFKIIFLFVG